MPVELQQHQGVLCEQILLIKLINLLITYNYLIRQVVGWGVSAAYLSTTLPSCAKVTTLLRKVTLGKTRVVLHDSGIRMS